MNPNREEVLFALALGKPTERREAMKVGMDTKRVVARFMAERQAPAMMDSEHLQGTRCGDGQPLEAICPKLEPDHEQHFHRSRS